MEFITALNIVNRLPPSETDAVVANLVSLCPRLRKFLLSRVDCRLQIITDESTGKPFIASDFNRIGCSYRSPWSNTYIPSEGLSEELYFPSEELRKIEITFNELLLSYCALYYDNAVGSVYLSESPIPGLFYGVFQIKKDFTDPITQENHCWESNHSFSVKTRVDLDQLVIDCSMTSSVLTVFEFQDSVLPSTLSGSDSRSSSRTFSLFGKETSMFEEVLIRNLGEMMEDNENTIRGMIDKVEIPRCTELAIASFDAGNENDEELSDDGSDFIDEEKEARVSLGSMNPLHRQSIRPMPAFHADLIGAITQRKVKETGMAEGA